MTPLRIAFACMALSATAGAAAAQAPDEDGRLPPLGWSRGVVVQGWPDSLNAGGRCVRWCAADLSPCDPNYYKVADRRCNPNQSGYYN